MSTATISSLGLGSGLELQDILDQLREVDERPINSLQTEKIQAEEQLAEYNVVNGMLLTMKSHALALSLEGNFLEKDISVSDEDVVTATVVAGASKASNSLEVVGLATRSSWQTAGVASASTSAYVPTIQESTTGFASADTSVITTDETMTITYGNGETKETINVNLTSGWSLDEIVTAINTDDENTDKAYVTAETFEVDGSHYLRIKATSEGSGEDNRVMVTDPPTGLSFAAPDATFSYSLGIGDPITISVSADTTISYLAELINDDPDNPGVTASVIDDGTGTDPYRLVLIADDTGEDNRIELSQQLDDLELSELEGAGESSLNSIVIVNGITYQRQSNTGITDIIQGVTLNLESVGTSSVIVSDDTELIKSEIIGLVESFNGLVQEIITNSSYAEETEDWGILASSFSVKRLPQELSALMNTIVKTVDSSTSLHDLGMEVNRDGTITLDEDVLNNAISSGYNDVKDLFLGDEDAGVTGLGDLINGTLRDITMYSGLIDSEKDAAQDQIDRIEEDIETATERLDKRYEDMARQFAMLDVFMSRMQAQSTFIDEMFSAYKAASAR